ncbi:hypothetical protein ACFL4L_02340 [bacterium]
MALGIQMEDTVRIVQVLMLMFELNCLGLVMGFLLERPEMLLIGGIQYG